jgi:hypothetical protein
VVVPHWLELDGEVDDGVSVVSVSETELSSSSPSAPPTIASRASSSIVSTRGAQLRFRYPPAYLGSAPPIGHPASTAITTPPPCKPRNKPNIAPATKSFIMTVCVWWQHIGVVAIKAGIVGWEVDVIDQEVDVFETEVDLIDQEVDVFETEVDLIDQDVDVVENEVDVLVEDNFNIDFEEIGFGEIGFEKIVLGKICFEEVDVKFKVIEFEKINVEGQGADEFRVTGDIQVELVLFNSAWRVE